MGASVRANGFVEPSGDLAGGIQLVGQVGGIPSNIVRFGYKFLAVLASEPEKDF